MMRIEFRAFNIGADGERLFLVGLPQVFKPLDNRR